MGNCYNVKYNISCGSIIKRQHDSSYCSAIFIDYNLVVHYNNLYIKYETLREFLAGTDLTTVLVIPKKIPEDKIFYRIYSWKVDKYNILIHTPDEFIKYCTTDWIFIEELIRLLNYIINF